MSTSLTYLGGASEVGRVGAVLEGPEGRLLLDYGLQPDDPPKYPLPAPEVDALLLTHAHLDHVGAISEIKEKYPIPFYLGGTSVLIVVVVAMADAMDIPVKVVNIE